MAKYVSLDNLTRYDSKIKELLSNSIADFITKSVNDLTNYYTKSQTYTQAEVNSLISGISSVNFTVVEELPEEDIPAECRITEHFKNHIVLIDVEALDVSEVTTMANMFKGYNKLTTILFFQKETSILKNRKLKWNIGKLKKGQEFIINYTVIIIFIYLPH